MHVGMSVLHARRVPGTYRSEWDEHLGLAGELGEQLSRLRVVLLLQTLQLGGVALLRHLTNTAQQVTPYTGQTVQRAGL